MGEVFQFASFAVLRELGSCGAKLSEIVSLGADGENSCRRVLTRLTHVSCRLGRVSSVDLDEVEEKIGYMEFATT